MKNYMIFQFLFLLAVDHNIQFGDQEMLMLVLLKVLIVLKLILGILIQD